MDERYHKGIRSHAHNTASTDIYSSRRMRTHTMVECAKTPVYYCLHVMLAGTRLSYTSLYFKIPTPERSLFYAARSIGIISHRVFSTRVNTRHMAGKWHTDILPTNVMRWEQNGSHCIYIRLHNEYNTSFNERRAHCRHTCPHTQSSAWSAFIKWRRATTQARIYAMRIARGNAWMNDVLGEYSINDREKE